ncbi:MAG: 30S ribosomal protein S9 [Chloroflexi bacterium RBG_16_57_8]|nr:MAG: 30S ribosomal protein S9 [Chloroflexi bacterium RBG_16_57_8]
MDKQAYVHGTGRRKTAVAQVRLTPGGGGIVVNGKPYDVFFPRQVNQQVILKPLAVAESQDKFNISIKVAGGGVCGQATAIAHGIARALLETDPNLRTPLRQNQLLTRDARAKERKKVGLKRARKKAQSPKR